jgi:hypothetical protein
MPRSMPSQVSWTTSSATAMLGTRGEVIHDRPAELAAQPAGGVGAGRGERAVGGPVVGDDLVPRQVVGLHEHRAGGPGDEPLGGSGGAGRRTCERSRGGEQRCGQGRGGHRFAAQAGGELAGARRGLHAFSSR